MCEFCDKIKEVDDTEYLYHCLSEGIVYEKQSNTHYLITRNLGYDWDDCLGINYCPMCGRKISEVSADEQ